MECSTIGFGWRAALLLALCVTLPASARGGEVKGRVRFEGVAPAPASLPVTKDRAVCGDSAPDESLVVSGGGLANVVVRVVVPGARPEPRTVSLDQQRCRYVPHVVAAPVGSTLELKSADEILHSVHGYAGAASAFDVPMPEPRRTVPRTLGRAGAIRVACDVHGWMAAWVVVVDGPHYAVSDATGRFSIAGVPAGTYTAVAWHERLGERIASVTVSADGAAELDLAYR